MTTSPRLRFAAGRAVLWRNDRSIQLGTDPRHAVVIDGLSAGQAAMLRRLDGRHGTGDLLALAAAGACPEQARRLLDQMAGAGLTEPADHAERTRPSLAPDAATWALRTGRP